MKRIIIYSFALLTFIGVQAQNSIDEVLQSIVVNNKELRASQEMVKAQILEAKTDNNLPDPTVSYVHQWRADDKADKLGELVVSQGFDFPTLYASRNKLNRMKANAYDGQASIIRQDILLQAKELCLDIIMLRQEQAILKERLYNANELATMYKQRLAAGDANIIETNKINLELLNVKTEVRLNETSLRNKMQELMTLNGNNAITFDGDNYPQYSLPLDFEVLKSEVIAGDPNLQAMMNQNNVLCQQVSVEKQGWIPKLEVGYRLNTQVGATYNGVIAGISIPIFQNRNKTKIAKAQLLNNNLLQDNIALNIESTLMQNYNEAQSLYSSMSEYQQTFQAQQDLSLLKQALTGGQISMIEYFVEVSVIYQSKLNYLQLENQYQKLMAQIYKYQL